MNIKNLQPAVEQVVKEAGDILLSYFNTVLDRRTKKDGSFATDADLASEQYLIKALGQIMPEAGFYAEESGVTRVSEYMWVIDPLDGTTNFAQGISYFCISVALTYNDERILGVIYQPTTKDLFSAVKGYGTTLNDKKIKVSDKRVFSQSVIGCALSYNIDQKLYSAISKVKLKAYSVRVMGAAALDAAYCAAGRFDGIFFKGLSWWDVAAGSLIIEEAGGSISTFEGKAFTGPERSLICGSEFVLKKIKIITD